MSKTEETKDSIDVFERHAQTIIAVIIAGLISWVGFTVLSQSTNIAILTEKFTSLEKRVERFTDQPRFTRNNFDAEMRLYESRLTLMERELERRNNLFNKIDDRLRKIEVDLIAKEEK